jgi:hypothetical protein
MANLNDEMAKQIMGEIDTLTRQLDKVSNEVTKSVAAVNSASKLIMINSNAAVENAKETARQSQLETYSKFNTEFALNAAKTMNEVAGAVSTKAAVKWIIAGVVVAGFFTMSAGVVGYNKGKDAGAVMAGWVVTEDGVAARKLSATTGISKFLNCSDKGWQIEKRAEGTFCFPYPDDKDHATYGWKIK